MAKSLQTIELDFGNARRQADELEQIARNLHTLISQNFDPCLHGIAAGWKGKNATAFCRKGKIVEDNIIRSASDLKNAAETMRKIAENTYETEKRIYELAQRRGY